MDLIKGNTLIAQANTQPVSNISTAILLLVAIVGLWLLLKLFIRIILLVISLAASALAGTIFYTTAVPYVETLYSKLGTEGLPLIGSPPDPRLTAFASVFLMTFLMSSLLLAVVTRRS